MITSAIIQVTCGKFYDVSAEILIVKGKCHWRIESSFSMSDLAGFYHILV